MNHYSTNHEDIRRFSAAPMIRTQEEDLLPDLLVLDAAEYLQVRELREYLAEEWFVTRDFGGGVVAAER